MLSKNITLFISTSLLLLSACSGGGSDSMDTMENNMDNMETDNPFSEIAGVWNVSYIIDVNGVRTLDREFVVIRSSGSIQIYDDQNDDFGTFLNCYYLPRLIDIDGNFFTSSNAAQLTEQGDRQFNMGNHIYPDYEDSTLTLVNTDTISVRLVNGDIETWNRESNLIEENLTPICN